MTTHKIALNIRQLQANLELATKLNADSIEIQMTVGGKTTQAIQFELLDTPEPKHGVFMAAACHVCTCTECGSDDLTWDNSNAIKNDVIQGRLNTSDVVSTTFLGCNNCSATLVTLSADDICAALNAR